MADQKTVDYNIFRNSRKDGYYAEINSKYGSVMAEYYRELADINNTKRKRKPIKLSPNEKNEIVKQHRLGNTAQAAKLLGFNQNEIDIIKEYSRYARDIDKDVFDIDEDAQFVQNLRETHETGNDIRERKRFDRLIEDQKNQTAEMRAFTQAIGYNKTESFVGRVPWRVKILVPFFVVGVWLLFGVVSCSAGL